MFDSSGSAVAAEWAARAPGPALAEALAAASTEGLDDAALVEVVAAWRRVESWAAGNAALAAAALAGRASMNPDWPGVAGHVGDAGVAAEELAMRLGCSRRSARELIRAGAAYLGPLWPSGDALLAGEIDPTKARVLLQALVPVPGEVAVAVQEEVLPRAGARTPAQLAADVQRALIKVDPDEAAERAALAVAERRVCRPTVLPDGMAGIWSVLPAPAAVALHEELAALAHRARLAGDPRTVDQLRADALCCAVLARGRADGGKGGDGGESGGPGDPLATLLAAPPLRAEVRVVVPLDALLGVADGAAELDGYGALSPATTEALAREGTWRRLVTDPLSGALLDVGRTRYRPPADLDRHVRTRDGTCVRPGCPTSAARCELDHTVPYGHEPDERGSAADGTSGEVPDETADGAPDGASGGRTSHDNLGALCKRDHLIKTHAGFTLRQVAPGVFEWTTPTGHRYVERRSVVGAPVGGAPVGATSPTSAGARRSTQPPDGASLPPPS